MSDASPESFVFAITDDIPKFDIGPEIPKQTRNDVEALLVSYRPNKIKTTDIELSITVTDSFDGRQANLSFSKTVTFY
ncbi:hypothetical protein TNIN_200161 [Trichonephila inaurata madagascariensis]|uniref:Uncharacterized protein n=1 Tax=Trichonephila inaurata madagascariensis TaxID=2747483 RepID=A0A8X6YR62_9ARAC|nr:hypothetical protein TNIN_200161 [Trichonephila inaurata madagascariensis]